MLDFPDMAGGRKLHARVTPLVGGIALVAATLLAAILTANVADDSGRTLDVHIFWYGATVTSMFLVGLADDRFGLSASVRLALAAAVLLVSTVEVYDFQLLFLRFAGQNMLTPMPGLWGMAFTVLCLVGFLNAVNMSDGKNGLVIGQALIWSAVLLARLPSPMTPILAGTTGALLVLMIFNMRGALFLGDSGSYAVSAIFGLLAVFAWNNGFTSMNADDVALIFAVPVFDTLRLMVQRVAKGSTPFTPGRDHLHHYLYAHWGWPRPLPWVLLLVALPNLGALLLPGTGTAWLGVTFVGYIALLLVARHPAPPIVAAEN